MAASTASPWESPWLLMLLLSCAALLGLSTAASPKPAGGPPGPSLERYRRLVPYMTYYVAQGLAQRPAALQTLQHNGLEAFSPPGRVRGGGGGFLLPAYVVRGTPGLSQGLATGGPPRPLGALAGGPSGAAAAASTPSAGGPPPRTVFRFDFQQQPQQSQHGARAVAAPGGPGSRLKDQPFLPSPPLKPEDEDSEDYFKPVTDTANYYRGTAPTPTPGPPADQEQHLVVFPEDEARLRAKLRQQQKQQHHHQLLLQQQQLDDAYRLKLLLLQQQQLQQAKELRAHMQAQRQREHLRAQLQQERDIRALVQAQQAKRLREQQLQAQLHSQQQAQDLKQLRDQHLRLQHEQEIQAQQEQEGLHALREQHLQAQLQARLKEQDLKAQRALQLQTRLRALELKKLRAQQLRLQQDQQLHAQLQAHLHAQAQQAQRTQQQQQLLQEEELRAQMHMQHQRDHDAPTSPATAPAAADTEVEQQVVVSLEDVEKGLPPSAAAPDPATAPAPNELPVESTGPSGPGPSASTPTPAGPVVYAEEVGIPPLAENADPPMSSSKEIVAHLINGLQLSNKLPQSLTPENFDMSLKTILQLLKVLHKSKAANGPITTPARVKVSPDAPERDTAFYIGGGTVSQTFPAPSVEGSTPGRPGIDYPAYDSIPKTSFSCATQRYKGFFGDEETNCQVWHYCDLNGGQASFLCPNGTIFSQVGLTCDWWFNVRCASTAQLYVLNERLYKYILPVKPSFPEDYSGPDVDRYLTEKFREMQAKARGRKEKLKSGEKEESPTTSDESGGSDEPIETNQTEAQEVPANKSSEVPKDTQIEEQQKLDPDL